MSNFVGKYPPFKTDSNGNILVALSGGGSAGFNSITSGTNTTATMIVGSGASLSATGTGTITATAINFSGITSGTNTTGAMVVGTGGSLAATGTGTITATNLTNTSLVQAKEYEDLQYGIPLQHFQAKLAQVKKGTLSKVRIFCLGDSTTGGKGAGGGDPWGNSWPAVLTQLFQKNGFNATTGAFYASGDGTNASSTYNSKRLTLSGAWATQATPTLGGNLYVTTTTAGSLSFTPTDYWDTAIITYLTNSTQGTFTTDIDGGSPTTTNGNGSTSQLRFTQTTATPGIHTLNWKYVSGTKVFASGVECYNSTLSQVMIVNCGWGGVTTGGMAAGTQAFDPIQSLQFQAPDLTIFGTIINDWLQLTNMTNLATAAQSLITTARLSGDCIWMLSVPSGISNTPLATQQAYVAVIRGVCATNNVPVVDIFDRFQSYEITNPFGLYSDTIHENGPGYDVVAEAVFKAINPRGENPNLQGIIDGSNAAASVVGEYGTSTVAIGAAVSLTSTQDKTITSITLQPGDYDLWGNIGFIANTGTIPTVLTGSISTTTNTQATSPNGGAFAQVSATLGTATTSVLPVGSMRVNPTVATTYYLVGTATFTVSTLTAYGSLSYRRRR